MELTLRDIEFFAAGLIAVPILLLAVRGVSFRQFRRLAGAGGFGGRAGGFNFTQRVRESLAAAREHAADLGHEFVDTEHILLGVLETDGVAVSVLRNLGIDVDKFRAGVIAGLKPGGDFLSGPDLPYTSRAKRVLEQSMDAARELKHNYVGSEHLLLGLISVNDGVAAKVLASAGVTRANALVQTQGNRRVVE